MAQQIKPTEEPWYALTKEVVLSKLNVAQDKGLTSAEVQTRQAKYGRNELPVSEGTSLLEMIVSQFKDVTVIVLIVAAVISFFIDEAADAFVILAIVTLNAMIGVYQERQAENALAALSKMQTPVVRVRRDNRVIEISATELVPGDIVLLEAGDSIPADGRLIEAANVKIDEAAMTGESLAVDKSVKPMEATDQPPALADRLNVAYMGTALTYGRGEMVVTSTGLKTQLGHIAALLQSVEQGRTPLQERLEKVGYYLAGGALLICAIVFLAGTLSGEPLEEMFLIAISLAVAAVPEGLPAIITVSLALGANRMIKRNALIRKLPAVETLGSVTVICSDKTGTLTRNEMTVTRVELPERQSIHVTGVGFEPVGQFVEGDKRSSLNTVEDEQVIRMVKAAALCTDAYLVRDGEEGPWHIVGDTTEGALLVMACKLGWSRETLEETTPRIAEIPFTSERKAMTTIHKPVTKFSSNILQHAPYVALVKGAPDALLEWTTEEALMDKTVPMTPERRQQHQQAIEQMAAQGMRVLGLAYRVLDSVPENPQPEQVERNLVLLGLIGMVDPPRTEAIRAVAVARSAGIRPIMITGDHRLTAAAIAKELGIISPTSTDGVLSGAQLDQLAPEELLQKVKTVSVFARVSPEHKLRVVEALQKNGEIVAMTGDGVNDAPALKQANIGVAMGITGTDVSKGAADMVLTDDNFASIVAAVEEGRTIYDNIRKFLSYLIGSNIGEIVTMFTAIMLGMKIPLLATQILWINLVTDGLPAIALGFEPSEPKVMERPPRPPKESIFARGIGIHVLWVGLWLGITSLISYLYALNEYGGELFDPTESALTTARSMTFTTLALAQLFHVAAIHAGNASMLEAPVWKSRFLFLAVIVTAIIQLTVMYIPFMQDLLGITSLSTNDLIMAVLFAASVYPAIEIEKWFWRQRDTDRDSEEGIND